MKIRIPAGTHRVKLSAKKIIAEMCKDHNHRAEEEGESVC